MATTAGLQPVLGFLSELEQNNNKPWFEQHRAEYEHARTLFEHFVDAVIEGIGAFEDLGGLSAKDCLFRMHRDVRFAQDKSPYKTGMGASIGYGGRHASIPYYVHIEPGGRSMVAGGLYAPTPDQLSRLRHAIGADARPLKQALADPAFVACYGALEGERVKTAPQGFARDHPEIELLKWKQFITSRRLSDAEVAAPGLAARVARDLRTLKPLLDTLKVMIQ